LNNVMKRTVLLLFAGVCLTALIVLGFALRPDPQNHEPEMVVYLSPTCGCCVKWVQHMQEAGFKVESRKMRDMGSIKKQLGVPRSAFSCHTAVIDGYVVEGHVPAPFVQRLLKEKPEISGIAVPEMPIGSPGMEGPNAQPYEVVTFNAQDTTGVYALVDPRD